MKNGDLLFLRAAALKREREATHRMCGEPGCEQRAVAFWLWKQCCADCAAFIDAERDRARLPRIDWQTEPCDE